MMHGHRQAAPLSPGFYSALQNAIQRDPAIHAAFYRVINIDEDNEWIDLSVRERHTALGCSSDSGVPVTAGA